MLGIVVQNSGQLVLWDANTRKKQHIDIGLRDCPSILGKCGSFREILPLRFHGVEKLLFIALPFPPPPPPSVWSVSKQVVCMGTTKGNLSIYNHHTQRRTPILGKHSKRITGGCWSKTNQLALISDDKTMSISNEDGDSLRIVQLSEAPSDLQFAKLGRDERGAGEGNLLSLILGRRVLFLYNTSEPDAPIELGFQQHYGDLERHVWFGEGLIALAFSRGFIVTISTNPREMGQELTQIRVHTDCLADFDLHEGTELIATCGQDTVKIHQMKSDPTGANVKTLTGNEQIASVRLSGDGQLLAVSTIQGGFCIFVTQLSALFAVNAPKIAVLTNLSEISIYNFDPDVKGYRNQLTKPSRVTLELEPDFISVGPAHLACGLNNHVVFYDLGKNDRALQLNTREFHSQVSNIKMTDTMCAVLCGGQLILQTIESQGSGKRDPQIFPDSIPGLSHTVISNHELTSNFLIISTDVRQFSFLLNNCLLTHLIPPHPQLGHLIHFDLRSWTVALQYRNDIGIKLLCSDRHGIRVIFVDDQGKASMYMAAPFSGESVLPVSEPANLTGFLWDSHDNDLFIGFNKTVCNIYVFVRQSLEGPKIQRVAEMRLLSGAPVLLSRGEMVVMNDAERMTTLQLSTHSRQENKAKRLEILRKMYKLEAAWDLCKVLGDRKEFEALYQVAVETLNIRLALRVQRHLGNVAQVRFLEEIQHFDDIRLLQGFCAILLNKTEVAQQILLKSATSINYYEALELCRDLLMWEQALTMAQQIAPQEVFAISLEYAQQLEFSENYRDALTHYERAMAYKRTTNAPPANLLKDHDKLAMSGIARASIRCGDYEAGVKVARELRDPILLSECGHLLVGVKQLQEAVKLFELGGQHEDACKLYIQMRAWKQVEKLLPQIDSPQLHLDFAKASEEENRLEEALRHYKFANDIDNVVRLHLMLNDAHSAQEAILEVPSVTGSKLLAGFYQKMGHYEEAIRFLVQCDSFEEAFQIAKLHKKLPFFGEHLEKSDNAKAKDFRELAEIFESEKYTLLAGKYYFLAREFHKALKFLMKASAFDADDKNISLSLAIDCVAMADDESGQLTKQLIEFLLGETDGAPKDPRFLFRLYMAKKEFRDAAKIAVVIAQQEQTLGNYRSAHDLLFQMSEELKENQLQIGAELRSTLILLHRYIVARAHVKLANHDLAARLLCVVGENVSRFPSHTVPILTSAVIECQRAGLRQLAFKFASQLMRPELRAEIPQKYAKKIEAIVRKHPKGGGAEEGAPVLSSPCPFCGTNLEAIELNCYQCKETLPMCIASGLHVTSTGLAMCGKCNSPCIRELMVPLLGLTESCPMCGDALGASQLVDVSDVRELI